MYMWIEKGMYSTITSMSARAMPINSKLIGLVLREESWRKHPRSLIFIEATSFLYEIKQQDWQCWRLCPEYRGTEINIHEWVSTKTLNTNTIFPILICKLWSLFGLLSKMKSNKSYLWQKLKARTGHRSSFTHLLILHFVDKINNLN